MWGPANPVPVPVIRRLYGECPLPLCIGLVTKGHGEEALETQ